ncbi:MAG: NAD-dependent epimerase/dehydratase family protein [Chloroflexi bacterium]|nr:NAD-dependent epimerase/dehydratase family protein [Chloroflexota bacterium]
MIVVARGRHVVFGTGPVGVALARLLRGTGRSVVAVPVNEYGSDPVDTDVVRGDPTDYEFVSRICEGAEVVYLCLNGPPAEWHLQFPPVVDNVIKVTAAVGTRLILWDLAHMYGPTYAPVSESTPNTARSDPARVLSQQADKVIDATWTGKIDGAVGRSADVFGPGAINPEFGSSFGDRVFWPAIDGTELTLVGDVHSPRSLAFVDDVANGLIILGEMLESSGHIWHLPCAAPITPFELASMVVGQARSSAEVGTTPRHLRGCALMQLKILRADIEEVQHELHALDKPFVLEHSRFTTAFGETVTPHNEAIRTTLAWYNAHPRPIEVPVADRLIERLPQVARTSRLARRLGSGALGLAKS